MNRTLALGALWTFLAVIDVEAAAQVAPAGAKISGRVNPADDSTRGNLVPGIPGMPPVARGNTVQLTGRRTDGTTVDLRAPITADGVFEFSAVPSGGYYLLVQPATSIPQEYLVVGDRDIVGVQLGTPRQRVSGTVTLEGGGPLPVFKLEFIRVNADGSERDRTAALAGSAFSTDLSAGRYRVVVAELPAGFVLRSVNSGSADLARGTIEVSSAASAPISVALGVSGGSPWVRVRGRVDIGSLGTAGTAITISGLPVAEPLSTSVGPDGRFEFARVLPGKYEAVLLSEIPFSKTITVGNTGLTDLVITLPSSRDLVGEFVRIEPGQFMMGCSPGDARCNANETPVRRVGITRGFEMGKYEVTQAQWTAVMGANPSQFKSPDRPVENVNSWEAAQEFIRKLNTLGDAYRYRLPTEAEWEYAARAGTTEAFPGAIDALGWYGVNSGRQTHPVGEKRPNAWGLYDMLGNVWEWVDDWYAPNYPKGDALDPVGPSSGPQRVLRGGSWSIQETELRVSYRGNLPYSGNTYSYGLRLVREAIAK